MARTSDQEQAELEGFWRNHRDDWQRSDLNHCAYYELYGLFKRSATAADQTIVTALTHPR